mmetsp:Transcript_14254/g.17632  ORF Transcript_14254/g.17632 Transcript_14254/m.17632 type:complete len:447 (+) Transcript_14254:81-1421(+)|eukprot:CAMPEP_0204830800 /NCGR_PEP_ID=MMETSP1346-20131115/9303_1 /ASSEMBLY_ACC=CAM_ASM_000771 /TAXON_ID=215587 /ORGANISM="Aplanochytrium stocchinoi, Strain GSBS06" /LENGTH=446 /DNA_ID=CAMNT_0051961347 /DNA_START=135 /DNA_END=1475 /DNA_ORIENTATION=-
MAGVFRKNAVRALSTAAPKAAKAEAKKIAFIDGARIPFTMANTTYSDLMSYDLARLAMKGILDRTAVEHKDIDNVIFGTVVQEVRTSNIAREAALGAGIPNNIPAHTVSQACISANQAICSGAEKILAGQADVVLAGGSETFSDVPIRYSRPIRKRLLKANKALKNGPAGIFGLLKGLKAKDFAPDPPAIKNFSTEEVMGHSSDRLASRFGVSRQEQDEFALRSHQNAAKAHAEGVYDQEIIAVNGSTEENGIRADSSLEKLASLKPAFVKPHGTHTAANSSFLTDGAAAVLIMEDQKAKELGYTPRSYIKNWTFQAVDPFESMLLGPAYCIHKILSDSGLTFNDIGVWEIHEAFAGQVLSNLNALDSEKFCAEEFGKGDGKYGRVPEDKLNLWGGSLSIGHPFGATGARLVTTATNRLHKEDKQFALVAACADSGIGHACLIERA